MRARGVSIAPARYELFYKEVGEAAGRFVVRQMCPPDIGISDTVSFNGELIYRHFRNVFELKRPGQHLGLAGIRQRCSRRRFQPLRSRPVNRLNPPRCLLEPAAVESADAVGHDRTESFGRRVGFPTTRIVAFRDILIASHAAVAAPTRRCIPA